MTRLPVRPLTLGLQHGQECLRGFPRSRSRPHDSPVVLLVAQIVVDRGGVDDIRQTRRDDCPDETDRVFEAAPLYLRRPPGAGFLFRVVAASG
jgi:hypothetical protein